MRKILLTTLVILSMLLSSCITVTKLEYSAGGDTDNSISEEITRLDQKVIESIKAKDADMILEICEPELSGRRVELENIINAVHDILDEVSFQYMNSYHTVADGESAMGLRIMTDPDEPFYFDERFDCTETYASLLRSDSGKRDLMLFLQYIEIKGSWKLSTIYFGEYMYEGMTAPDFYEKARELEESGYYVPALIYAAQGVRLLHPLPFFQYRKKNVINGYVQEIQQKAMDELELPYQMKTKDDVVVYGVNFVTFPDDGIYPRIQCHTTTSIEDYEAIKAEGNLLHDEILDIFPGLEETFPGFFYEAYNEVPDGSRTDMSGCRALVEFGD